MLDDDALIVSMLARALKSEGYETRVKNDADNAVAEIVAWQPDLVMLDIHLDEDKTGLDILAELRKEDISTQVIMLTADDKAESAITAMKLGAADYLTKPFNVDEVKIVIQQTLEKVKLKDEVTVLRRAGLSDAQEEFVGCSAVINELRDKGEKLAAAGVPTILITGESGTGKEVMARFIHNHRSISGGGAYAAFVAVNSTALPAQLFESELFGHAKGAFTDAKTDKKGLFELAADGTILLDEIGDLELSLQTKLLRVVEERRVRRIGGQVDLPMNVTVIATTNRDLALGVSDGTFRKDLFYRLNTFALHIPPLRDRKEDICLLAHHFLQYFGQKYFKKNCKGFSLEAEKVLLSHDWPGNVRELKNMVERIVVLENAEIIGPEHLPFGMSNRPFVERRKSSRFILPENGLSLEELEKDLISQAMQRAGNNQTVAAKLLHISYDTLRYQIKKFDLK